MHILWRALNLANEGKRERLILRLEPRQGANPEQLPFLPPGQQPTVSFLRGLITKQTWTAAAINKGDTWWLSDATGAPLSNASQCHPESGEAWLPFGAVSIAKAGKPPARSTEGLMKPLFTSYPSNCGVSNRTVTPHMLSTCQPVNRPGRTLANINNPKPLLKGLNSRAETVHSHRSCANTGAYAAACCTIARWT